MKILFLSNYVPYPADTGTKIRSLCFLNYLRKLGAVTLVAPGNWDEYLPHRPRLLELCEAVHLIDPVSFGPHSGLSAKNRFTRRLAQLFRREPWCLHDFISHDFRRLLISLCPNQYDLIFIRYPHLAYYFLTDPAFGDCLEKTLIDVDDVGILMQVRRIEKMKFGYEKIRHSMDLYFLKSYYRLLKKTRALVAASVKDRKYLLEECYGTQVFTVPNILESPASYPFPQPGPQAPEMLFCGALSFPHNEEALFFFVEEVFPLIRKSLPDARLTVIGKNPTPKVMKLVSVAGLTVIPNVPATKPYYERAALAVVPLKNGAGTRIKILEAMTFGKPVVSTTMGAEGLDISDGENICIADTAEAFAAKCVELLTDIKKCRLIGFQGYLFVRSQHSPEVFERAMDEVVNHLGERNLLCPQSVS